jgi:hypothetical protein
MHGMHGTRDDNSSGLFPGLLLLLWLNLQASSCHSIYRDVKQNYCLLVPLLAGRGR